MKIIALGDTHGRPYWKDIVSRQVFDKFIFIGDYFDTKEDVDPQFQMDNFISICEYKEANLDKVILLFGNHDYHYLEDVTEEYSGFEEDYHDAFSSALQSSIHEGLLQMCFGYHNILFTHAGITKTWCKQNNINVNDVENAINDAFIHRPECFGYFPLVQYGSGRTEGISPIWVRPDTLLPDKLDDYIQVVGHTMQPRLRVTDDCIFIDTLGTSKEYLIIEEGKCFVAKI